jgi:flagellar biogenesis protein FliO
MENISYIGSLFKMLLALAVVLAMMVGTVYLLKNVLGRSQPVAGGGDVINILAVRSLGPRSSIMVIETLGRVTVIGLSGGQMSHLAAVDDPEALERIKDLKRKAPVPNPGLPLDALREKIIKTIKRK